MKYLSHFSHSDHINTTFGQVCYQNPHLFFKTFHMICISYFGQVKTTFGQVCYQKWIILFKTFHLICISYFGHFGQVKTTFGQVWYQKWILLFKTFHLICISYFSHFGQVNITFGLNRFWPLTWPPGNHFGSLDAYNGHNFLTTYIQQYLFTSK